MILSNGNEISDFYGKGGTPLQKVYGKGGVLLWERGGSGVIETDLTIVYRMTASDSEVGKFEIGNRNYDGIDLNICYCTIDWGDGTTTNYTGASLYLASHKYDVTGLYTVHIKGRFTDFRKGDSFHKTCIEIKEGSHFGSDIADLFAAFKGLYTDNYNSLTSIPTDLFKYCRNLQSVMWLFMDRRKLKTIPENLFANCHKLSHNTDYLFGGCLALEEIPDNIFVNQTHFLEIFRDCVSLKSIPSLLFAKCPQAKSFSGVFYKCTSLTSIPENLFANNPDVTSFGYAFYGCTGITSPVPRLWETHPNAGGEQCFRGCVNAANYSEIPDNWK